MVKNVGRILILVIAVLVIVFSVGGIFGAWGINIVASNFTRQVFSVIQADVEVVDTAVSQTTGSDIDSS